MVRRHVLQHVLGVRAGDAVEKGRGTAGVPARVVIDARAEHMAPIGQRMIRFLRPSICREFAFGCQAGRADATVARLHTDRCRAGAGAARSAPAVARLAGATRGARATVAVVRECHARGARIASMRGAGVHTGGSAPRV